MARLFTSLRTQAGVSRSGATRPNCWGVFCCPIAWMNGGNAVSDHMSPHRSTSLALRWSLLTISFAGETRRSGTLCCAARVLC